ncbi:MAG: hypothetical protein COT91_03990 [Candidatus Doudnabacteria bacterium CG10_big_fil_rev_8_21_14_0_10_41_10]|uniref:Uncharacterized protein n=1 Tax=Candidatus Doudnabacteria bacterium CG10_big_fil_rev_8_21_14_0_10_41_10 TaxID=1974551 RepID=A0A2H0VCW2_9BACT|nr:MAG: hypothetical protein COT91_03990 [Candidatus Doudnabacteria bacterium CG10_big_fil_rev_8_21_14_0_10_41_10]
MTVQLSESPFGGKTDCLIVAKVSLNKKHWPHPFFIQLPFSQGTNTFEIDAVRTQLATKEVVIPFFVHKGNKYRSTSLEDILKGH